MSEYLLLTDFGKCPKCRRDHRIVFWPSVCRNCGMMLFQVSNNFVQYEVDTSWREYWVWTGRAEGWKHRSAILDPNAKPLSRIYIAPKLDDDYGTEAYNERKKESIREPIKEFIKTVKKSKRTVRVVK